jgi:hypothetical protein
MAHTGFTHATEAFDFIFGGKAVVTLTSTSSTHFTFKITASDDGNVFFVKHLFGPDNSWDGDWAFLGVVFADNRTVLRAGKKGKPDAPSFKALNWALGHLRAGVGDIPADLTIQHNDQCGVCGRELTDPVSVATGIGPICRSK